MHSWFETASTIKTAGARRESRREWFERILAAAVVLPVSSVVPAFANSTFGKSRRTKWSMPGLFPGRVVSVQDARAIVEGKYQRDPISAMMRRGMMELTGAPDWVAAWRSFFEPGEVVGIKLNPSSLGHFGARGCGWRNDPSLATYRSCSGAGKYGGDITITYNVTVVAGAGTSQTLNPLIYDFSGSSYHYNSDYSTSSRIAVIADPSTCTQTPITQWTFTGNLTSPSTGAGTFTPGSSLSSVSTINQGVPAPALSGQGWSQAETIGANAYYQFAVATAG